MTKDERRSLSSFCFGSWPSTLEATIVADRRGGDPPEGTITLSAVRPSAHALLANEAGLPSRAPELGRRFQSRPGCPHVPGQGRVSLPRAAQFVDIALHPIAPRNDGLARKTRQAAHNNPERFTARVNLDGLDHSLDIHDLSQARRLCSARYPAALREASRSCSAIQPTTAGMNHALPFRSGTNFGGRKSSADWPAWSPSFLTRL